MSVISVIDQSFLGGRGTFFVGGHISGAEGKRHMCNQMFVEVYVPSKPSKPYPLILFHGAGQTNLNWGNTPDGRMGWADYFVSQGYTVYLAEQPARARSAYHPEENGPQIYHPAEILTSRFASQEGPWPQAALHSQWPTEDLDWHNPIMHQFLASQVEYLPSNAESQRLVLEAGRELLQLTGPAILLTHSQAGPFGWLLADACPDLVKGILALEPSGPPFSPDVRTPRAKNYGLADLPLHFEPPIENPENIALQLLPAPAPGLKDGWVFAESKYRLPRLSGIPILVAVSEASYHAGFDHLLSHVMTQCGVVHDFVRLEDVGIHGNSHMMMLEKNNLEIARWLCGWMAEKQLG